MLTERKILLALFAIALGIRVLYGAFLSTQADLAPKNDARAYTYAKEIASGTRWITEPLSPRSPGYPVVLAAFHILSAKQTWLVMFFQSLLGALTVIMVYRLGRQLLDVPFATVAALWFAFHAHHVHFSYVLEREILSVFLLLLVLFFLVRPFVRMRNAVLAGLAYAALVHVDPQFLLLFPLLVVFVFFKTRHRLLSMQYLFVFVGVLVVASVPWTIRNYAVYDQPLPIGLEARRFLRPVKLVATEPAAEISEITTKIVTASRARVIEHNAVEFWRIARFRGDPDSEGSGAPDATARRSGRPAWSARHIVASVVNYGIMLPFFVLGLVTAVRRRDRCALMLAATVAVYFLMRAYLGGSEHTRLPIDPLIVLLGFYGISWLFHVFRPASTLREARA